MKPDRMASVNIGEVVTMYQILLKEWNKKPPNLEKCGKLLSPLKVMVVNDVFLVKKSKIFRLKT